MHEFAALFRGGSGKGKALREAVGGVRTLAEVGPNGQASALWAT